VLIRGYIRGDFYALLAQTDYSFCFDFIAAWFGL
jgi:hypothetical protein